MPNHHFSWQTVTPNPGSRGKRRKTRAKNREIGIAAKDRKERKKRTADERRYTLI
jgi:hypothetical protein